MRGDGPHIWAAGRQIAEWPIQVEEGRSDFSLALGEYEGGLEVALAILLGFADRYEIDFDTALGSARDRSGARS